MDSESDQQLRLKVNQRLVETGQKEALKEQLRNRLVDSGWRERLRTHCKDVLKTKSASGKEVTVEELVAEITPFARSTVPDDVKAELLGKIKQFIDANFDN